MNDLPKRKPLRLSGYDYSKPGYYFVTVCTAVRGENILAEIYSTPVVGAIINRPSPCILQMSTQPSPVIALTPYGTIVEQSIHNISHHYSHITVDSYAIMPDHVHMLLAVEDPGMAGTLEVAGDGRQIAAPTPIAAKLPTVIQQFKRAVSKTAGYSVWQKGYYDHIIRNEEDLQSTRQYIQNNPLKWLLDRE